MVHVLYALLCHEGRRLLPAQEGTITWAKSAPTETIKKHMMALAKLAVKLDIPLVRHFVNACYLFR